MASADGLAGCSADNSGIGLAVMLITSLVLETEPTSLTISLSFILG